MLEINRKIAMMRGGDYHLGEKRAYLCSASVCFWVFAFSARTKKIGKRGAPEKNKMEGTERMDRTPYFYGHSYSAPTPTIYTLQQIGLTITKEFDIHIRYVQRRFLDHSAITLTPNPTVPLYNGQSIGT